MFLGEISESISSIWRKGGEFYYGTASAYAKVRGNYGTVTKVSANMYLEKYNNGKWPTVRTWSDSKNSNVFELSRTTSVAKGLYRVRTVFTVYSGAKSETITRYSSNVRY